MRIQDSVAEAVQMGDKVIQELLDSIRTQVHHMFRVCESVALLDMLSSFAHVSVLRDYTKPNMTGTLGLKAARHPVLDKVTSPPGLTQTPTDRDDRFWVRIWSRMTSTPARSTGSRSSRAVT